MTTARQIVAGDIAPIQIPWEAPGYIANNWYLAALIGSQPSGGGALSVTTQYMAPFILRQRLTIGSLGIRTVTPGTSNVQLALYANDSSPVNRPGTLLQNTGNIANNGVAGFYPGVLGASIQLDPGIYWSAIQCNDTTCAPESLLASSSSFEILFGSASGGGAIGNGAGAQTIGVTIPSTFGTWASAQGATFTELVSGRGPAVAYQIVSVP